VNFNYTNPQKFYSYTSSSRSQYKTRTCYPTSNRSMRAASMESQTCHLPKQAPTWMSIVNKGECIRKTKFKSIQISHPTRDISNCDLTHRTPLPRNFRILKVFHSIPSWRQGNLRIFNVIPRHSYFKTSHSHLIDGN
jgi:hypothetical protein